MKKILIVEDERILAVSLKMDLNEIGYQTISVVTNGEDAIAAVQENLADIVLMDINIQGDKSGIETAESISTFSAIPIIYLTGETDGETRSKAMSTTNCKGYLSKPVNMTILQPLLLETLSISVSPTP